MNIFRLFQRDPADETIEKRSIIEQVARMGIHKDDPRIEQLLEYLNENCPDDITKMDLTTALSGSSNQPNPHVEFIMRVLSSDLLMSDFQNFKAAVSEIFARCKKNVSGTNSDYLSALSKANTDDWGVSICTVDG